MKSNYTFGALAFIVLTVLSGCATYSEPQAPAPNQAPYQANASSYGVIDSIQITRAPNNATGAGVVVGGLVGGLLGNQIGSGNGRTAATVVGAVGGAVVGNTIEQNRATHTSDTYQVQVRLDNGGHTSTAQDSIDDLRVGDRVRITNGRAYRY
ncbi:hypothetical protein BH11PSE12_BH11PSE12_34770 [soil metagenome]